MNKTKLTTFLIYIMVSAIVAREASAVVDGEDGWRIYSQELNGDVYFFDSSRMNKNTNLHRVWSRIRYKTSVMGASSYQSLLEVDCYGRTERILQNTFFSDKHWKKPAMKTDNVEKPKLQIVNKSATGRLYKILCNQ